MRERSAAVPRAPRAAVCLLQCLRVEDVVALSQCSRALHSLCGAHRPHVAAVLLARETVQGGGRDGGGPTQAPRDGEEQQQQQLAAALERSQKRRKGRRKALWLRLTRPEMAALTWEAAMKAVTPSAQEEVEGKLQKIREKKKSAVMAMLTQGQQQQQQQQSQGPQEPGSGGGESDSDAAAGGMRATEILQDLALAGEFTDEDDDDGEEDESDGSSSSGEGAGSEGEDVIEREPHFPERATFSQSASSSSDSLDGGDGGDGGEGGASSPGRSSANAGEEDEKARNGDTPTDGKKGLIKFHLPRPASASAASASKSSRRTSRFSRRSLLRRRLSSQRAMQAERIQVADCTDFRFLPDRGFGLSIGDDASAALNRIFPFFGALPTLPDKEHDETNNSTAPRLSRTNVDPEANKIQLQDLLQELMGPLLQTSSAHGSGDNNNNNNSDSNNNNRRNTTDDKDDGHDETAAGDRARADRTRLASHKVEAGGADVETDTPIPTPLVTPQEPTGRRRVVSESESQNDPAPPSVAGVRGALSAVLQRVRGAPGPVPASAVSTTFSSTSSGATLGVDGPILEMSAEPDSELATTDSNRNSMSISYDPTPCASPRMARMHIENTAVATAAAIPTAADDHPTQAGGDNSPEDSHQPTSAGGGILQRFPPLATFLTASSVRPQTQPPAQNPQQASQEHHRAASTPASSLDTTMTVGKRRNPRSASATASDGPHKRSLAHSDSAVSTDRRTIGSPHAHKSSNSSSGGSGGSGYASLSRSAKSGGGADFVFSTTPTSKNPCQAISPAARSVASTGSRQASSAADDGAGDGGSDGDGDCDAGDLLNARSLWNTETTAAHALVEPLPLANAQTQSRSTASQSTRPASTRLMGGLFSSNRRTTRSEDLGRASEADVADVAAAPHIKALAATRSQSVSAATTTNALVATMLTTDADDTDASAIPADGTKRAGSMQESFLRFGRAFLRGRSSAPHNSLLSNGEVSKENSVNSPNSPARLNSRYVECTGCRLWYWSSSGNTLRCPTCRQGGVGLSCAWRVVERRGTVYKDFVRTATRLVRELGQDVTTAWSKRIANHVALDLSLTGELRVGHFRPGGGGGVVSSPAAAAGSKSSTSSPSTWVRALARMSVTSSESPRTPSSSSGSSSSSSLASARNLIASYGGGADVETGADRASGDTATPSQQPAQHSAPGGTPVVDSPHSSVSADPVSPLVRPSPGMTPPATDASGSSKRRIGRQLHEVAVSSPLRGWDGASETPQTPATEALTKGVRDGHDASPLSPKEQLRHRQQQLALAGQEERRSQPEETTSSLALGQAVRAVATAMSSNEDTAVPAAAVPEDGPAAVPLGVKVFTRQGWKPGTSTGTVVVSTISSPTDIQSNNNNSSSSSSKHEDDGNTTQNAEAAASVRTPLIQDAGAAHDAVTIERHPRDTPSRDVPGGSVAAAAAATTSAAAPVPASPRPEPLLNVTSIFKQIELDVHRTTGGDLATLRRVLWAFSLYCPAIGFCQGMSYVAMLILRVMESDEEETFWTFVSLMEVYGLKSLYLPGLRRLQVLCDVLDSLIHRKLPALGSRFDALSIQPMLFAASWIQTCFADLALLHEDEVLAFWDVLLCEPQRAFSTLMQMMLAILKSRESELLQCRDMYVALEVLRSRGSLDWIREQAAKSSARDSFAGSPTAGSRDAASDTRVGDSAAAGDNMAGAGGGAETDGSKPPDSPHAVWGTELILLSLHPSLHVSVDEFRVLERESLAHYGKVNAPAADPFFF